MATLGQSLLCAVIGALLLAGCGGGDQTAGQPPPPDQPQRGKAASESIPSQALTDADIQRLKAFALRSSYVRGIVAGSHPLAFDVVPWVSEGGREVIGGRVKIRLDPPVRLVNERLPGLVFPNQKAPPGTPTLNRFARISASDVTELDVSVELDSGRAVQIEPAGEEVNVTKVELIGPPPEDPAYAPEPGY